MRRTTRGTTAALLSAVLVLSGLTAGATAASAVPVPSTGATEDDAPVVLDGDEVPRTVLRSALPRSASGYAFEGSQVVGGCTSGLLCTVLGESRVAWDFTDTVASRVPAGATVARATLTTSGVQGAQCTTTPVTAHAVGALVRTSTWANHASTWGPAVASATSSARCDRWGVVSWDVTSPVAEAAASGDPVALGLSGARSGIAVLGDVTTLTLELAPAAGASATALGTADPVSACVTGEARPAVRSETPDLTAELSGEGNDLLLARFSVQDLSSGAELWTAQTEGAMIAGSVAHLRVPSGLLHHGGAYAWEVRAATADGGPWSEPSRCELVVDLVAPELAPVITPVEGEPAVYREDATSGGVGVRGAFVLSSEEPDVVAIRYSFGTDVMDRSAVPGERVEFTPTTSGAHRIYAQAVDSAGATGPVRLYRFSVTSAAPVRWAFSEGSGLEARDTSGSRPLTLAHDGMWGRGYFADFEVDPSDGALVVADDASAAWSAAPVASTGGAFSVGATVRADATGTTRAAVSQVGDRASAFSLGVRHDAACGTASGTCWAFWTADADADGSASTVALSGVDVKPGSWVRLTGVRDAAAGELRLYVCEIGSVDDPGAGETVLAGAARTTSPGWSSSGGLQVGRAMQDGTWTDHWRGAVDRLSVVDGVVSESQMFRECQS
ncbi:LamG-like jellyroll fold domain-containing protein [Cellulosimicrobium cellulans]|uniref:LamG-like jellyroll fold domain-containing protein n=1 Tax=Cellulosimicrobium cellulans TaxID=1710 RepID=UPI0024076D6D|nr:LamG-like jellyroll fold domain-containing protein [Cellulosimicrobium cellulans]